MDINITELILNNQIIAYLFTNKDFIITEISKTITFFYNKGSVKLGDSMLDVVPELIGNETTLTEILNDQLPKFELAWVNRQLNNEVLYINLVFLPYRDKTGQIIGLVHLMQDVTQMGMLEQQIMQKRNELSLLRDKLAYQNLELKAANTELQQLSEMKSVFVSVAAHEIRSPLSAIIGYLEMLLDGDWGLLDNMQTKALNTMQRSANRLLAVTNNLLDVTRIETGRIDLLLIPVSVLELVEHVVAEWKPKLETKQHQLTVQTSPDLPLALLDVARANQIIANLISNANKYTPEGGHITVSIAPSNQEGFLQLSVADTGIGIAVDDQSKVFSRFFRASNAHQGGSKGTGLGLHITRSLVELHGGHVWFESQLGLGSNFHVTFPIVESKSWRKNSE